MSFIPSIPVNGSIFDFLPWIGKKNKKKTLINFSLHKQSQTAQAIIG